MGLTKQYLAYRPVGNFNIIASQRPNCSFTTINSVEGRHVAVGAAENVIIWDLRLGEKVFQLSRDKLEITALRPSPDKIHIAVGYIDGNVEIFDLTSRLPVCTLSLHRSAVSILRYDSMGLRLTSGSHDTDLVVTDVVSQTGKSRLSGHTGPITDACFVEKFEDVLVSSSKDTQIKFWSLETQSCFKTIVDHRTEVWGLTLMRDFTYLVSGSSDSILNVYKITANENISSIAEIPEDDENAGPVKCKLVGTIQRAGKGRTIGLVSEPEGNILGCFGTDSKIELFYFCSEEESLTRLTKRLKKLSVEQKENATKEISLSDEIKRMPIVKTDGKVKSIDLLVGANNELRISATYANNLISLYSLKIGDKKGEARLLRSVTNQGHHSEVRSVSFSSDNLAIVSGSADSLKLWNRPSMASLRTIDTGYILSVCFVPGDRHVLLGLKSGNLLIADVVTGEIIEDIPAHQKELWSICLLPDLRGCATGGGDTTVKTWTFELIPNKDDENIKTLSLIHQNTLKLEETVLCVKISPNSKFIAVALLDSTVKIFFLDTFKFYLSLYGHKLPVLCLDISYDSKIIATGSADRNVKIWGLDFGDCHRSLFAHDDSVMGLQFVPKTHQFFTCGKDGKIKQWDGDTFVKIMTLPGHIGEAYSLAVSPNGTFLVSCGSDRVLRLFERTDELIVLQDIQEEEREEVENRMLVTGEDSSKPGLPGLKLPSKKTVGSEKGAELILECLEISNEFDDQEEPKEIHPIMTVYEAKNSSDFLVSILGKIRASDLEESLLLLPFTSVCEILKKLPGILKSRKDQTELICKVVLFLFRIHQKPIVSNQTLLPIIRDLITNINFAVNELRDMIGVNFHALQLFQRDIEAKEGVELFMDATRDKKAKDKKNKRRLIKKRLHVQMST